MNGYNTPGISIAILPPTTSCDEYSRANLLTCTFGVRDCSDSQSSVDAETIFQAASISKPFTALAVLRLVVQGKLNLDTDIEEYLALDKNHTVVREDLHTSTIINPVTVPRTPITLRMLLAHRSGLSTVSGFAGYYGKWAAIPSTPATINGHPSANNLPIRGFTFPGLGTSYSGGGTTVVQYILTLVTGKSFPDLMRELVLDPLGMSRSTYEQPIPGSGPRVNYAKAHHNAHTEYTAGTECMIYPEMAAAGLWTTPSDILKGLRAVFDCLSGTTDSAFLPPALVAESFTELNGFGGSGVGKRRVILGHGGSNQGFKCGLVLVGDMPLVGSTTPVADATPPVGIALMSNSDHGPQLADGIVATFGWLVGAPLKLSGPPAAQRLFPVLVRTPADRARVDEQTEGWRAWKGRWRMKAGGDVALYGPHVDLHIGEDDGMPTMRISVLADPEARVVLLPAAFHHPEAIVWVVRDMNVAVAMKKEDKLEIWQNGEAYEAERD
ncbi:beta-lactamase/transpeptidase-like protein [Mycena sanguinolenta]|nr:beta-lactamase/transpeptidase-like protein [Mycena sanguinolenta]